MKKLSFKVLITKMEGDGMEYYLVQGRDQAPAGGLWFIHSPSSTAVLCINPFTTKCLLTFWTFVAVGQTK